MHTIRKIFSNSGYIGQGNPAVAKHPVTPQACQEKLGQFGVQYENANSRRSAGQSTWRRSTILPRRKAEDAGACIDQFEFPDIPCTYPVVWVRAREAAEICRAMGKRICDAHEWEGACAGALEPPGLPLRPGQGRCSQRCGRTDAAGPQQGYGAHKSWAYGAHYEKGICAASSHKTPGCGGGSWTGCGSNTYPSGTFPDCHSPLGVYDQHGNAAEHMNLPLNESQMASRGSRNWGIRR